MFASSSRLGSSKPHVSSVVRRKTEKPCPCAPLPLASAHEKPHASSEVRRKTENLLLSLNVSILRASSIIREMKMDIHWNGETSAAGSALEHLGVLAHV